MPAKKRVLLDFSDGPEATEAIAKIIELAGKSDSLSDYTIFNI